MQYTQIVSGLNHSVDYPEIADQLVEGTELTLVPNPENPFDKQAIKVCFEDKHIGWIPMKRGKELNLAKKEIFEAMEAGVCFKAEVLLHDLHRPLYDRLTISIRSIEDREPVPREALTCFNCECNSKCPCAWDEYNTDGDCLMEK